MSNQSIGAGVTGLGPHVARPAKRREERLDGHAATSSRSIVDRRRAERRGRLCEWIAAGLLTLKGYRVIERRHRNVFGEIDLIAVRGRRLAFVEVKQRATHAAAAVATTGRQATRMCDAVERWLWRHPTFRDHRIGLDVVALDRACLPRHLPDALHAW